MRIGPRSVVQYLFANAHPLEILLRLMLIAIGGFILLFVMWQVGNNLYIISSYDHARAEVTKCDPNGPVASKGLTSYGVSVRLPSGRTASMKDAVTRYDVGEVIDVYYKPETAYSVIGGDFMQMWFHITMVGATSLTLLFFGLRPDKDKAPNR